MLKHNPVFEATYSSVPVWEMNCSGISVMRRRLDSYLNATQILKVAGVDKGRRTKILDKDVVGGLHEKVQGGFSKYQGTWIPFERGVQLAQEYKVEAQMAPILASDTTRMKISAKPLTVKTTPTNDWLNFSLFSKPLLSPPLAAPASVFTRGRRRCLSVQISPGSEFPNNSKMPDSPCPSVLASSSFSSVGYGSNNHDNSKNLRSQTDYQNYNYNPSTPNGHVPPCATGDDETSPSWKLGSHSNLKNSTDSPPSRARQRNVLMALFFTDDLGRVPTILSEPGLDINMVIDEAGNTSMHWAAVLANHVVLDALYVRGGDVCARNTLGQTPIMSAVRVADSHQNGSFYSLLQLYTIETISLFDCQRRTVLHHIAQTCARPYFWPHALFYLDTLINRFHTSITSIINKKECNGNTALSIAIGFKAQGLVSVLRKAGAY